MAKADFKLPDEFLTKLSRLGKDTEAVTEKVLEAGGKVVLARVRSNLAPPSSAAGQSMTHALQESWRSRSDYLPSS